MIDLCIYRYWLCDRVSTRDGQEKSGFIHKSPGTVGYPNGKRITWGILPHSIPKKNFFLLIPGRLKA